MMDILRSMWRSAKVERKFAFGPVLCVYRFRRNVSVSSNTRRRLVNFLWRSNSSINNGNSVHAVRAFTNGQLYRVDRSVVRNETAVIIGVGPGLGFAVARKLVSSGMSVALASRNAERLDPLVYELRSKSQSVVRAYGCDATCEVSVKKMMSLVVNDMGVPNLVIYSVQGSNSGHVIDIEVSAFEESWRQNCLGGFIVAREAARRMLPLGRGTVVLIGSPSGIAGRAGHLNLAVGKFGLRALAQVMSRELWSAGIHVVHVVIDGDIKEEEPVELNTPQSDPEDIADLIYVLHRQPKSTWTSEIDVRPCNETFWEHC